ncbi:STAS domain-containing protein [Actinokineospora cianjurensis]|uniref:Anti-sigma B factor antagonist n=1 Tax=Actinokineospora cianjurensis TaxID=585224 RepID=A0A421AUU2_9PSEU|nr:STAS domain-containing protein [Actinokineospora cianjurensis]RLK53831.1 anti-sigma B factor antagonist [Actinokineospora cianjurensis]
MDFPAPRMTIRLDTLGASGARTPVVRLRGDLDLATKAVVDAALTVRLARKPPLLVVDLSGVAFVGACGLTLLTDAQRRARGDGGRVAVACCAPPVLRAMEVSSLLGEIAPYASVADALAANPGVSVPEQRGC